MKQFFLMGLFLVISFFSWAQTADEIIQKHIDAIGGADNWRKINTMTMQGSSDMGGMKIPITMSTIHKKALRVEFEVQGMKGIQVVTDKDGWSLMPFMGQTKAEPTPEEQLKSAQSELDIQGDLIDYAAKGNEVEALGEEEVDGVETYKIKLTEANKNETTYFFDKENYMILKAVLKATIQGQEVEQATSFGNYKKVGDITMPYSMTGPMGVMEITDIKVNPTIDSTIFDMPK
jgi:outer membrane lipoprotein-sorting protein